MMFFLRSLKTHGLLIAAQTAVVVLLTAFALAPVYAAVAPSAVASIGSGQSVTPAPASIPMNVPGTSAQTIAVTETFGLIERQQSGSSEWKPVKAGDLLQPFDTIRTGADGTARIEFDGKIRIQILSDCELTIDEALRENENTRQTLLKLGIGKIKADVDKLAPGSTFKITTPTSVAAVRGTTLYLSVVRFAKGAAGISTDLFVEKGKVDFASLDEKLKGVMVEAFHASSAGGNGGPTPPQELTAEERDALVEAFEAAAEKSGNPQLGVESGFIPGGAGGNLPGDGSLGEDALEDLINDLIDLREEDSGIEDEDSAGDIDLLGALKLAAVLLSEGVPQSGGFDYDNINADAGFDLGVVTEEREDVLDEALGADNTADVLSRLAELQVLRDAEKEELRGTLDSILSNQEFLKRDAAEEKAFDAQTGKVFTDVHGNRVRTDQYIYHEDGSDLVRLVSLTLRTGEYQRGVSSVEFGVRFNGDPLAEFASLRDMPWNDYLNVVSDDEFEAHYLSGTNEFYSEQYIVHEHSSGVDALNLYPTDFYAEFKNPAGDRIKFAETYSTPFQGQFTIGTGESTSTETLWTQGRIEERTEIQGVQWCEPIIYGKTLVNGYYESLPDQNIGRYDTDSGEGVQTAGIADSEILALLGTDEGLNILENLPINNDGDPSNDLHPAYFADKLEDEGGRYQLVGFLLPIDNEGHLIDQPGFTIEGVRGLISPNHLVAGGQYNLETIFMFGDLSSAETEDDTFTESFRIDAIITPEIFSQYGTLNASTMFPDRLPADEDDDDDYYDYGTDCITDCGSGVRGRS